MASANLPAPAVGTHQQAVAGLDEDDPSEVEKGVRRSHPADRLEAAEFWIHWQALLIVPRALAAQFAGGKPAPCPVGGYDLRSLGEGSVTTATRDWDDPYFFAADVHNLVGRRNDPGRLFNAGYLWEHYSVAADGSRALLQLVGFTSRPNESVSMALSRRWRSVAMYTIGSENPVTLQPVTVEGRVEYHLPPFSYYAALESRS